MQKTGVDVIERNMQILNLLLDSLSDKLGGISRQDGWERLRAVLHTLRDRLPTDEAVKLASQFPVVVRGAYYENWKPTQTPVKFKSAEEYAERVTAILNRNTEVDATETIQAVMSALEEHVDPGILEKVCQEHLQGLRDIIKL